MAGWRSGTGPALTARADGLLEAQGPVAVPFMGPALQGQLSAAGELRLSRWGFGEIGRVQIVGLEGPLVIGPNRIVAANGACLAMAQSAPALTLSGATVGRVAPGGAGRPVGPPRGAGWVLGGGGPPH